MIRTLVLCGAVFAAAVTHAEAETRVLPPDSGIQSTIDSQMGAFLKDDFERAFTYASPGIRGLFGTSDRFGEMVRNGYPMVWRPETFRFLDLRDEDGALWQRVLVEDAAGRAHILDYQMIPGGDGWLINGVHILPAPQVGA